jgi:hypothetical protein
VFHQHHKQYSSCPECTRGSVYIETGKPAVGRWGNTTASSVYTCSHSKTRANVSFIFVDWNLVSGLVLVSFMICWSGCGQVRNADMSDENRQQENYEEK